MRTPKIEKPLPPRLPSDEVLLVSAFRALRNVVPDLSRVPALAAVADQARLVRDQLAPRVEEIERTQAIAASPSQQKKQPPRAAMTAPASDDGPTPDPDEGP